MKEVKRSKEQFVKELKALGEIRKLVRSWASRQSILDIVSNPLVANRLEQIERGYQMIEAAIMGGSKNESKA